MDDAETQRYFTEDSQSWVESSYKEGSYSFPTALARMRRTLAIIKERLPNKDAAILDLGCGAGQLCLELAMLGYRVTGVDRSPTMISQALRSTAEIGPSVQTPAQFIQEELLDNHLDDSTFSAVVSLGVIGYLPTDDPLFLEAFRLLKPGGLFICSCRNRLFDMASIGPYTSRDIEEGFATELVAEIQNLYQSIPDRDAINFVRSLANATADLNAEIDSLTNHPDPIPEPIFSGVVDPRQHTPEELKKIASRHNFEHVGFYGVHPHLLIASLNRLLPPTVFNRLSSSLETLSHLPISLIWSSAFIGVFTKSG